MSNTLSPPPWLAGFQKEFGSVLRQTLDRSNETLCSSPQSKWRELGASSQEHRVPLAGLSDYNRQYWFRLFTVLQDDFPLGSRLLGYWKFNKLAESYLQCHPPTGYDIHTVSRNFLGFCENLQDTNHVPRKALMQAFMIDECRRKVLLSPKTSPLKLSGEKEHCLTNMQLHKSPAWELVEEDWTLLDLALALQKIPGENSVPMPHAHPTTRFCLIRKTEQGLMHHNLPEAAARLFQLLCHLPLNTAIEKLSREANNKLLTDLIRGVQGYMQQSMRWGLWVST